MLQGGFNLKPVRVNVGYADPCRSTAYVNYKHHIPNHMAATFASELGKKGDFERNMVARRAALSVSVTA